MIFILAAIVFSTWLVVMFKVYEHYKIDIFQGVVFNYATCWITGLFFIHSYPSAAELWEWNGLPYLILLGSLFIAIFMVLGYTAQRMGVMVASVAQKLSFVLPVLFAIHLYGESVTWNKVAGSAMAIGAVLLLALQRDPTGGSKHSHRSWWLPLVVFIGSGTCDVIFNEIQRSHILPGREHFVTTALFFVPFCIGGTILAYQFLRGKSIFAWKNVAGGIFMGLPNYFSLFFLMAALQHSGIESSALFPVINIGIVGLSTLAGILIFREPFPVTKKLGLILALSSIIVIAFLP